MRLLDAIGVCEGLAGGTSEGKNVVYESAMDAGQLGQTGFGENLT